MTIPCDILVFGGTGDLALNKLLPALYHLFREGRLHNAVRIIALARRPLPRIEFLKLVERRCRAQIAPQDFSDEVWHRFSTRLDYFSMDAMQSADFGRLAQKAGEAAEIGALQGVHGEVVQARGKALPPLGAEVPRRDLGAAPA